MPSQLPPYLLVQTIQTLKQFEEENRQIPWMCFDTEFVGEKRFYTRLCLIQVYTPAGIYLLDPFALPDLEPFLKIMADPAVEKITHAGENDYRLLQNVYGILPANLFDTQVAAGFAGYKYPISFAKLVESELTHSLDKSYAVADWEARPFSPKQLQYALEDVIYLPELANRLKEKLSQNNRLSWALNECSLFERPDYYERDPYKEALSSGILRSLRPREQVFLLRLYNWRTEEARRLDYSKEMVLSAKIIPTLVRSVASGMDALQANRRLPPKLVQRHGAEFVKISQAPPTPEEKEVLKQALKSTDEDPEHEIIMEVLHLLIRYRCLQEGISSDLVMPRGILNKLKADLDYFDDTLESGWRRQFLGEEIIGWLRNRHHLEIEFLNGRFELKLGA